MNVKRLRFLPLLLLAALLLPLGLGGCAHTHEYTEKVILPTCTSIGYTIHSCKCGEVYYSDYQTETPHEYGDWVAVQEATAIYGGEETRSCLHCGKILTRDTECTSRLPKIRLTEVIGSELKTADYQSSQHKFECRAILSENGSASGKPDYVISFCDDDRNPYAIDLGWGQTAVYALKGYAKDPTRQREETASHFWAVIREAEGETAFYLSDGSFPVQLYLDGVYAGLYALTRMPGYESGEEGTSSSGRIAFLQTDKSSGCLFKTDAERYEDSGTGFLFATDTYTDITLTDKDKDEAWASFTEFHSFVRESTDSDFAHHLDRCADVDELIDFFLFSEMLCAADAGEAGVLWYTDDGKHWKADFSMLYCSIGISPTGSNVSVEEKLPGTDSKGHFIYSGNQFLWTRLSECFKEEITERYRKLRETISADSVYAYFLQRYETLPPDLLEAEKTLFPAAVYNRDPAVIRNFLTARLERMDTRSVPETPNEKPEE